MNINLTLFGQTVTFIVFVWFCLKFIWPHIIKAMEDRKTQIAEGLAAGERGRHEHELAEQRAVEVIRDAKDQAKEILAQAHRRGDEIVEEAKVDGRAEGERMVRAAEAEIEQQMNQAREQLRAEVVTLALQGAQQVLGQEVDENAHRDQLTRLAAQL
ncbi:MAG: F0F1 ATP synthase subunit B [Gammaproteobacteria bacterium]|nr:F0F1 ATP synthase subunit B [Gammaproteobacteria bacterium]NIM73744.1 F0F1 ATP synthase subunit B [Gammaproteobacteria bacterium]NIN37617.1 F0F1 ATP synthase subunit B [Gammaproteobacteria bacterium]NIO25612.1 F0F1 ATP synthase subunit B [Gammaproteobacteria bacterium]NIO66248.1 F0F1 ATP synthase subunit B [Gammaproteobacteria bacterium]